MNLSKRPSPNYNLTIPLSPTTIIQPPQLTRIINPYVEQLKQIYEKPHELSQNIDAIITLIYKTQLHYFLDLEKKMQANDYKQFVKGLTLIKKVFGDHILEKGKKGSYQYVLLQGQILYNIKSQVEQQPLIKIGTGYPGFALYPEIFMSPRNANLSITCQSPCCFLSISQQLHTKYLKKLAIKQTDRLTQFLAHMPIFSGVGPINMRKYLAYFIPKCFKYNQIIYEHRSQHDSQLQNTDKTQSSCREQIYFIIKGSVQIYANSKDKCLNVVTLGEKQCFGLEAQSEDKLCAKSKDNCLRVLILHKHVFQLIKSQNQVVSQNLTNFVAKLGKLHTSIISKNIKVLDQKQQQTQSLRKKKKKKHNKSKNSLAWWGLAQNIKLQQKYKMPNPPKLTPCGYKSTLHEQKYVRTSLMEHKINQLKRRIIEGDEYCEQNEDQQNIDVSAYKNNNYAPKIKARIRVLEARPKAVDMAEAIKKKLVSYAKNMGSFCDRLNLQ